MEKAADIVRRRIANPSKITGAEYQTMVDTGFKDVADEIN